MSVVVKNLSKIYGTQNAVDDLSFTISEGEILGLLGPNGAGKSTTMKMMCGYLQPSAGDIQLYGVNVLEDAIAAKKLIGYLPEHNPLYTQMYVREFLEFVAEIHKLNNPKTRIEEVISQVGLSKEAHKKISALSKGYKQRVGIAQAIIHEPKVLILDEPISGLDPNQLIEIRKLILNLKKDRAIIFSSHILQEVEAVCDRVIILDGG